jgi:hypothetical protein
VVSWMDQTLEVKDMAAALLPVGSKSCARTQGAMPFWIAFRRSTRGGWSPPARCKVAGGPPVMAEGRRQRHHGVLSFARVALISPLTLNSQRPGGRIGLAGEVEARAVALPGASGLLVLFALIISAAAPRGR